MDGHSFADARVMTFDCYGTLIDWEAGILAALRSAINHDAATDEQLLEEYARNEAAAEAQEWRPYGDILANSLADVCLFHGTQPTPEQFAAFGRSVADWPAFPDSADALARLRSRFDLGVITNCDDDLFAFSNSKLGEPFRWVVTAEQARSYKPSTHNFEVAFERIGLPRDSIVHVAQSLFHDHVPAKQLGLKTVWINRRHGREGAGATPVAEARPDLTFTDMTSFADAALTW
jgi:2-haloacid dehalogenase